MAATALKASRKMTRKSWQLLQQLAASPAGQATSNSNRFATLEDIDNVLSGITILTDSTGGEANNTLVAITDTSADQSSPINDNFADLSAKINEILAAMTAVVTDE
jgi:hypothetical protein